MILSTPNVSPLLSKAPSRKESMLSWLNWEEMELSASWLGWRDGDKWALLGKKTVKQRPKAALELQKDGEQGKEAHSIRENF